MITNKRLMELAHGSAPLTSDESELVEIANEIDPIAYRIKNAWRRADMLKAAARIVARASFRPVFEIKIEMAAWEPEPAPARKSIFARLRRAA